MESASRPGSSVHVLAVVGLGYVGMPLVREAVMAGVETVGYDTAQSVIDDLNRGRSRVDDISEAEIASLFADGFRATCDPAGIAHANTYVICVPTPLSAEGGPDLSAVEEAARSVASGLSAGDLVVLESTSYPGTTEDVLIPLLEESGLAAGRDFFVAFSPERIDPGNADFGLRNTPKIVGGLDAESSKRAVDFYRRVCDEVVTARGPREAEMAKLLENTYRYVNIALVNEMAKFSREIGVDLWDAIRCASTKPFGFHAFYPGPGVGGHCIPIDPNYLSTHVRRRLGQAFRMVELAQEINSCMPAYVARRAQDLLNDAGKPVRGSKVLLLGVTYKPDIADRRESPAQAVAEALIALGAEVQYWDPHVPSWTVDGRKLNSTDLTDEALGQADCVVLLQHHAKLDLAILRRCGSPVLDTRGTPGLDAIRM